MIERRQKKDRVTLIHQLVTLLAVPAGLAALGWMWLQFDGLRLDVAGIKAQVAIVISHLDMGKR